MEAAPSAQSFDSTAYSNSSAGSRNDAMREYYDACRRYANPTPLFPFPSWLIMGPKHQGQERLLSGDSKGSAFGRIWPAGDDCRSASVVRLQGTPSERLHLNSQHGTRDQCMPKIDIAAVPARKGTGYPSPFDAPCIARTRQRLGEAGGRRGFSVHLTEFQSRTR